MPRFELVDRATGQVLLTWTARSPDGLHVEIAEQAAKVARDAANARLGRDAVYLRRVN